jgi:TolB protein
MLVLGPPSAQAAFPGTNGKIAFTSNRNGNYEIYTVNPDGTGLARLTRDPNADVEPTWSADGGQIAFRRSWVDGSNRSAIFVMNADGSGLR